MSMVKRDIIDKYWRYPPHITTCRNKIYLIRPLGYHLYNIDYNISDEPLNRAINIF